MTEMTKNPARVTEFPQGLVKATLGVTLALLFALILGALGSGPIIRVSLALLGFSAAWLLAAIDADYDELPED